MYTFVSEHNYTQRVRSVFYSSYFRFFIFFEVSFSTADHPKMNDGALSRTKMLNRNLLCSPMNTKSTDKFFLEKEYKRKTILNS
jgi:hypothetical protein